ncbi:MAG: FMN-binding protein [Clostridiales Family XIII bacterium]|nr:FMN-binding protein [Clostridiales Family XIII bacterium]
MKMNRKKALPVLALALACAVASAGCGGGSAGIAALADGEYHGVSSEDDNGAYGDITITIEGGAVTGCVYVTYEKDGGIKGEDYGKVNGEISNPDYYQKAQLAVDAMQAYADELARTGDPQEVDAISGATNSYDQFQEAAADALRG